MRPEQHEISCTISNQERLSAVQSRKKVKTEAGISTETFMQVTNHSSLIGHDEASQESSNCSNTTKKSNHLDPSMFNLVQSSTFVQPPEFPKFFSNNAALHFLSCKKPVSISCDEHVAELCWYDCSHPSVSHADNSLLFPRKAGNIGKKRNFVHVIRHHNYEADLSQCKDNSGYPSDDCTSCSEATESNDFFLTDRRRYFENPECFHNYNEDFGRKSSCALLSSKNNTSVSDSIGISQCKNYLDFNEGATQLSDNKDQQVLRQSEDDNSSKDSCSFVGMQDLSISKLQTQHPTSSGITSEESTTSAEALRNTIHQPFNCAHSHLVAPEYVALQDDSVLDDSGSDWNIMEEYHELYSDAQESFNLDTESEEQTPRHQSKRDHEAMELIRLMETQSCEVINRKIEYSSRHNDEYFEYRWVELPFKHPFLGIDPTEDIRTRNLDEIEWRALGIQQSRGWKHFGYSPMESHVLLFRRPLGTDGCTGAASKGNVLEAHKMCKINTHLARLIRRKYTEQQKLEDIVWKPAWPNFKEKFKFHLCKYKRGKRTFHLPIGSQKRDQLNLTAFKNSCLLLWNPQLWTPHNKVPRWCVSRVVVAVRGVGHSGKFYNCEGRITTTRESQCIGDGYYSVVLVQMLSGEYRGEVDAVSLSIIQPLHPGESMSVCSKAAFFSLNGTAEIFGRVKIIHHGRQEILLELSDGCPLAVPFEYTYLIAD